ncbi:hypothetical protein A3F55_02450 [Candidatus Adlerbacteria bacterium RIFCSPHIGHO2_12_FULL_53_18]|uniref:Uncharacterized protein n=1 Tax=Candidatus Adlerbacteria bacterium RIFCSPHIGHO2_12_FULL_53_18 TaxID=1797242 RepID=A0A1F4XSL2_9BACT|nr:MAG: hypothetical protein A3F55_02450 [Candidatus Adlerbacteria bacterium RIFCSPHIGHO2_12_FULL_53_18]
MQIKTLSILIAVVALLGLGGVGVWYLLQESDNTPVELGGQNQSISTNPDYTQTVTVPVSSQGAEIDPDMSYASVFATLGAKRLAFSNVATSTGGSGDLYALYKVEFEDYKKFYPTAPEPIIGVALQDLDGDGTTEAFVRLDMPGYCGTAGCPVDIHKKNGTKWQLIFTTLTYEWVGILSTKTNSYSDLLLSVHGDTGYLTRIVRYIWNGSSYEEGTTVALWNGTSFDLLR